MIYLLFLVLALLGYVSYVAYAKDFRYVVAQYRVGLDAWRSFSLSDIKQLAKEAWSSHTTLRSRYRNYIEVIFYPVLGIPTTLGAIVRRAHIRAFTGSVQPQ